MVDQKDLETKNKDKEAEEGWGNSSKWSILKSNTSN